MCPSESMYRSPVVVVMCRPLLLVPATGTAAPTGAHRAQTDSPEPPLGPATPLAYTIHPSLDPRGAARRARRQGVEPAVTPGAAAGGRTRGDAGRGGRGS